MPKKKKSVSIARQVYIAYTSHCVEGRLSLPCNLPHEKLRSEWQEAWFVLCRKMINEERDNARANNTKR